MMQYHGNFTNDALECSKVNAIQTVINYFQKVVKYLTWLENTFKNIFTLGNHMETYTIY